MNKTFELEVLEGYRIVEKVQKVTVWEAEKILTTRKQRYYTKAIKNGAEADLFVNYVVCPCCNKEFAANSRYAAFGEFNNYCCKKIPDSEIRKWCSPQLSIFEENGADVLVISSPIKLPVLFKCPECTNVSFSSDDVRRVKISLDGKKVEIKSEISEIKEIIGLKWIDEYSVIVSFPMYETVVFDIGNGKVQMVLENDEGKKLCQKDVTDYPELLEGSIADNLIMHYKNIRRTMKRMFGEVWKVDLPYCGDNITTEALYKMTMFVGYDKEFYSGVPYKIGSVAVEKSFAEITEKLHCSDNIENVFRQTSLPEVKSVKRIFFKNPSLFFYVREANLMWNIINNYDLYCDFLELPCAFEVLSDLHVMPGIAEYIRDFCKVKSVQKFLKNINLDWAIARSSAVEYACSCAELKKMIIEKSSGVFGNGVWFCKKQLHSVPMRKPAEKITDCTVEGYYFFLLRTSNEYAKAGRALENCLVEWSAQSSPVICVKKQGKYVAAIEISDNKIVQARGYRNLTITNDRKFNKAFEKWRAMYGIEWMFAHDEDEFLHALD